MHTHTHIFTERERTRTHTIQKLDDCVLQLANQQRRVGGANSIISCLFYCIYLTRNNQIQRISHSQYTIVSHIGQIEFYSQLNVSYQSIFFHFFSMLSFLPLSMSLFLSFSSWQLCTPKSNAEKYIRTRITTALQSYD